MSSRAPEADGASVPYTLTSDEQAMVESTEGTTACFPSFMQSDTFTYLPNMGLNGRTFLELFGTQDASGTLQHVSVEGVSPDERTVVPSEIFAPTNIQTRSFGAQKEDLISNSPESQWPWMEELGLTDPQLQSEAEHGAISQPKFKCSYKDCHGKNGKKRIYARREHRNRHEKTAHGAATMLYRCWVQGCRSRDFTRADNLKSHLVNRHGKKSRAGRFQYVTTQDRESIHYDPEWTGDVTGDGLPKHDG